MKIERDEIDDDFRTVREKMLAFGNTGAYQRAEWLKTGDR